MNINISDIIDYVFEEGFENDHPQLVSEILKEERYRILVEEIRILKEEYHSREKVLGYIRVQTEKTRAKIDKLLSDKNGRE